MSFSFSARAGTVGDLTREWGTREAVDLYLDRCQVDTPNRLVESVWRRLGQSRKNIGKVVDFGAGDGRFALAGRYKLYIGYEIDPSRVGGLNLPRNARVIHRCAFADIINDADVCVGNPPYVRNQDLPEGWRQSAAEVIRQRIGVRVSGLANAWQYFTFLSLASTKHDGLVSLVIPYEWVSRPSALSLRAYIESKGWGVAVYRLRDSTFNRVLTTSSITVIDKRVQSREWQYFHEVADGCFQELQSPTGASKSVLRYVRRAALRDHELEVKRGLSPGTQEVLTLTEDERKQSGLKIGTDVARCITSLRPFQPSIRKLSEYAFLKHVRDAGHKCWLVRTDQEPSSRLRAYLDRVPQRKRETATCKTRRPWWRFVMPTVPSIIVASGFRGSKPKIVLNDLRVRAVGGLTGVYGLSPSQSKAFIEYFRSQSLKGRIVAHSHGFRKLEVGQLMSLLTTWLRGLNRR